MFKGLIHTHSTYSDGEFTLTELRETLLAAGCAFVCMSDHAEAFDAAKLKDYIAECESLSDERFQFIVGLEFECEQRMHVLGYGAPALVNSQDPQQVIRHIHHHQGVAVIAHPKDEFFPWIESFAELPDGIETWNSKYDSRYAPRTQTFELLQRLQQRQPQMRAFFGTDLHWRQQYRGLLNEVEAASHRRDDILAAFLHGAFRGVKEELSLSSDGKLTAAQMAAFAARHAKSDQMRRWVKRIKSVVKSSGVQVPAPLKAQLRRIF
jgi:predicted metal-dependent phosphoesterase TrpH